MIVAYGTEILQYMIPPLEKQTLIPIAWKLQSRQTAVSSISSGSSSSPGGGAGGGGGGAGGGGGGGGGAGRSCSYHRRCRHARTGTMQYYYCQDAHYHYEIEFARCQHLQ